MILATFKSFPLAHLAVGWGQGRGGGDESLLEGWEVHAQGSKALVTWSGKLGWEAGSGDQFYGVTCSNVKLCMSQWSYSQIEVFFLAFWCKL